MAYPRREQGPSFPTQSLSAHPSFPQHPYASPSYQAPSLPYSSAPIVNAISPSTQTTPSNTNFPSPPSPTARYRSGASRGEGQSAMEKRAMPSPPHSLRQGKLLPLLTMVGFLVAGVAFAIGHHEFNAHLNGHPVSSPQVNDWKHVDVYSQRVSSAVGTAFTFLVKTCIGGAIGTSFLQYAWVIVQRPRKLHTVADLDKLFSARSDILSFLSLGFVRAAGVSAVMLVALWAVPLVAVFAPGSLGIVARAAGGQEMECSVPRLDLSLVPNLLYSGRTHFDFSTASLATRTVSYTMYSGQPYAPTNSPCGTNCTYQLNIHAPALSCNNTVPSSVTFYPSGTSIYWNGITFGEAWDARQNLSGNLAVEWGEDSMWYGDALPTFACLLYNASYTIEQSFNGSSTSGSSRVVSTQLLNQYPFMGAVDTETATTDPLTIASSNYEAIKNALYIHLNGTLTLQGNTAYLASSPLLDVMSSNLALYYNNTGLAWIPDLATGLEELMHNITLSFAALATSPENANFGSTTRTTCTLGSNVTVFDYHSSTLAIAYGAGLAVCFVCVLVGMLSLRSNGFGGAASFASFLDAMRNPALADPSLPLDGNTKLMYGPLAGEEWDAFGRDGEVVGRHGVHPGPEGNLDHDRLMNK